MRVIALFLVVAIYAPSLVLSQLHCHRCYGNSYCNNASHPDFPVNVRNATCNVVNALDFDIDDPTLSEIQKAINENVLNNLEDDQVLPHNVTTQLRCLSATVHEPHDSHTLRTCVVRLVQPGNTQTLCELLNGIVNQNNPHNGTFTCRECNENNFCNTHTLTITDGLAPAASTMISASFGFIIAMMTLYRLF